MGTILLVLLVTLLRAVFASQDTCGAPFEGEYLEDFHGGHSYVAYKIDEQYMTENYLAYQDRFCTKNGSGTIARLTSSLQKEDIIIEVSEGNVVVHFMKNHVFDPECTFTLNRKVIDGSNYLFKMAIKKKELSMILFRRYTEIYNLNVADISSCLEGNFSTFIYLEKGGQKVDDVSLSEGTEDVLTAGHRGKPHLQYDFDGCIGDSLLNGIPISKAGRETEKHDIYSTCIYIFSPECTDVCATSYIVAEGDKCACPRESEINDFGLCAPSCDCITCENGGTCSLKSGSDTVCECPPDYEGKYCEKETDRCQGFDCHNGGSCIVHPSGPSCDCLPNFTGIQCEVLIPPENPCEEVQCQNNGTCVTNTKLEEKYFCSCPPGYSGKICEHQIKSDTQLAQEKNRAIIGGTIGAAFVVGLSAAAIYIIKTRRDRTLRESKEEESPPPIGS